MKMFENVKSEKVQKSLKDAMAALNAVPEPHRGKILTAFMALDELGQNMNGYKDADKMMDDAASALTAMTKIDVRKDGICTALAYALRYGNPAEKADAIKYSIQWHIADYLKLKAENE